jgi:D-beta-D-heptose 7-phosphate kinase/D-beta-D-heptose 1-phosphate adenosyltransferase
MKKMFPSPKDLQPVLAELRGQGKRIVFTNGCFDLLHPGHLHTLAQARAFGDILVVGVNSDASVKRLKGEKRPILNENERSLMLAGLESVSYVTIFSEDTPRNLILLLRPDVLVKGGDWSAEAVAGKAEVESWGGRVELISYQEGRSTTDIIERVLTAYRAAG